MKNPSPALPKGERVSIFSSPERIPSTGIKSPLRGDLEGLKIK